MYFKKFLNKCLWIGAVFATVGAVISCGEDSGLGASVDIEEPKVSITTPSLGAVLGGGIDSGITVEGVCSDDKGVTRIAVLLKNTLWAEEISLGDATIVEGKTWNITFNAYDENKKDNAYNGYDYPDGTYEISVIAYDASGRTSGKISRSFDIDNTAPVFAITKPNSLLIGDPASYGRSVTIAGEIADDHAIQSMDIKLYQYDTATQTTTDITSSLAQTSFSGFETAGGTSVQIAQYYADELAPTDPSADDYKLYKNYAAMYEGANAGDTVSLYLAVTLTDIAGNTSEKTYIKSKLTNLVKQETGLQSTSTTLQTAQFKKILNGTYTLTELDDDKQAAVKAIMLGTYDTDTNYFADPQENTPADTTDLAMSINSDASPKFEVAGCLLKETDGEYDWNEANSEGSLSIKVSAGLDGWQVIPNTLKAALFLCDSVAIPATETSFKYEDAQTAGIQLDATYITNNTGTSVKDIETPVDMASYNLRLPTLPSGKHYLVYVYGEDEDGQAITTDNKYGFTVTTVGTAPEVTIEDKVYMRAALLADNEKPYTLTVSVRDPLPKPDVHLSKDSGEYTDEGLAYTISVYNQHIAQKTSLKAYTPAATTEKVVLTGTDFTQSTEDEHEFTTVIPITLNTQDNVANYTIAITVQATNSTGSSTQTTYLLWADNAAPAVQITNGDFVTATMEDGVTTYTNTWNNAAGGLITENSAFYATNMGQTTYKVTGLWSDEDGSGTATLYYSTASDTMPTVTVAQNGTITVADTNWKAFTNNDGVTAGLTDSVRWSYDFPVAEGAGKLFSFFAVDAVGNVSDIITYKNITFDFAVPTIVISTTPKSPTNDTVTIEGMVTESRLIKKSDIIVKAVNDEKTINGTVVMEEDTANGNIAFSVKIPADSGDGTWTVTANATDASGRKATEKTLSFVLDATKPVAQTDENHAWQFAKKDYDAENWYNTPAIRISGYYADATSGVATVYAQVIPAGAENPTHMSAETYDLDDVTSFAASATNEEGIYSFETTLSGFASGTNTVHLLAVDSAGNVSVLETKTIKVDQETPNVEASDSKIMTNGSAEFTISGTASDDASDIESIELYLVKADSEYKITATANDYGTITLSKAGDYSENNLQWTWIATVTPTTKINGAEKQWFDDTNLGSNPSVYARVTDKAGNITTTKVTTLSVDTTPPTTRIASPLASVPLNGTATISGSVTENQTPRSVALYYTTTASAKLSNWTLFKKITTQAAADTGDDEEIQAKTTYEADVSSIYGFTFADFDFTALSGAANTTDGKKDLYLLLVAEDEAGNVSVDQAAIAAYTAKDSTNPTAGGSGYYTYKVDLDTDRPVVKVMNLSANGATIMYATNAALNGTVTDDDADETAIIEKFVMATSAITATTYSNLQIGTADGTKNFAVKTSTGTATITPTNGHTYAAYKHTVSDTEYYDVTDIDLASGTWTFTPYDTTDGTKTVYMYIVDNDDTVFSTAQEKTLYDPKIQYTTGSATDNTEAFTYTSDSGAPTVSAKNLNYASALSAPTAPHASTTTGTGDTGPVQQMPAVGGKHRYVQFEVTAQDASGIKEMRMTVTDTGGHSVEIKTPGASGTDDTVTESGSFTANTDSTENIWKTGWIDLGSENNKWTTGSGTAVIHVVDQSGLTGTDNISFTIDNTAPTATVTSPSSTTVNKSGVTIQGTATDTGLASLQSVRYLIPKKDQYTDATEAAVIADIDQWTVFDAKESTSIWSLPIDSEKMGSTATMTYENGAYTYDSSAAGGSIQNPGDVYCNPLMYASTTADHIIYNVPFYVRAEDKVGNVSVTKYSIRYNPFTTPTASITYPATSDYDTGNAYVTLGGTIRVNGGATDDNSVYGVYLQVAVDATEYRNAYGETVYGTNDDFSLDASRTIKDASGTSKTTTNKQFLEDAGYTIVTKDTLGITVPNLPDDWWGIKVTQANTSGSTNWNFSLNDKNQFDISNATRMIALRVTAINTTTSENQTHYVSGYSDAVAISVDVSAPSISVVEMAQYTSTPSLSATETATSEYTEDMYLRGKWYFVADVLDESGISEWEVKEITSTTEETIGTYKNNAQSGSVIKETLAKDTIVEGKLGHRLYIPVNANVTAVSYTISVTDTPSEGGGTSHTTTKSYSFNIDNDAPVMASLTGNGAALIEANADGIATSASGLQKISNSNYAYTIAGELTEDGSGFERMAFYFLRDASTLTSATDKVSRIYDVMQEYKASDTSSRVNVSDLTTKTITQGSNEYTLYGKEYTGTIAEDGTTFTASGISSNSHIRKGGLIFVGGMYRKITEISGSTVTFDSKAATSTSATAFFPYAQVVDNTQTEKTSRNSSNRYDITGDDGDGMPEMVSKAGTTYNWEAVVYSDYIPDGPITLVCIAFDKAGNVSGTKITTAIQNNAPRIARLYLGTDLDGDNKYTYTTNAKDSEFNVYTFAELNELQNTLVDKYQESVEFATADAAYNYNKAFKITSGFVVMPEFTGGNGDIKLVFQNNSTAKTEEPVKSSSVATSAFYPIDTTNVVTGDSAISVLSDSSTKAQDALKKYVINDTNLTSIADGTRAMSFTFWDSTEGTVCGSDSNYCYVRVTDLNVDLVDDVKPNQVIEPFYWNSLTDNSVYYSGDREEITSVADLEGHIELEADLSATVKTKYGNDPKVSGKITMTGYAYDDQRLGSLWIAFDGLTPTNYLTKDDSGKRTVDSRTFYEAAYYTPADKKWTVANATIAANGWKFSLDTTSEDAYFNQDGHKVLWTLSIDTEKISGTAGLNKSARVIALDHSSNVSSTTAATANKTDGNYNVPTYQMDVVPYIKGLKTNLSKLKRANSSVYDRTALGHYAAATSETVYMYGFNLLANATVTDSKSTTTRLGAATTTAFTGYTCYPLTSIASFTSGDVFVTVNSVQSLNNINNDDAKGDYTKTTTAKTGSNTIYANYYNRQPNGDNNNRLTDNVVLDVWQFNSNAVIPISGKIEQPQMQIDPKTGQLGFAFVNGPLYFSMAGSTQGSKTSYDYWSASFDFFTSVGFAYDANGNTYGVAAGGDINSGEADKFVFMSSTFGKSLNGSGSNRRYSTYYGTNSLRLESIGQYNSSGVIEFDKQRIKSPSLVTSVHNSNTNVYLAYYDAMNDEIRFKAGDSSTYRTDNLADGFVRRIERLDNNNRGIWIKLIDDDGEIYNIKNGDYFYLCDKNGNITNQTKYQLKGYYAGQYDALKLVAFTGYDETGTTVQSPAPGITAATLSGATTKTESGITFTVLSQDVYIKIFPTYKGFGNFCDYDIRNAPFPYRNGTVSILAGKNSTASWKTATGAGQYVSLGVIPGNTATTDVVTAVWYDEDNRYLWYSYNTTPLTNRNGTTDASGWSTPVRVFTGDMENAGEYCQIVVDAQGGVHIAAYDSSNCDLVYAYLPAAKKGAASASSDFTACVVDSSGVVGSNITIDVALDANGKPVPRIGYYAQSCVRPKVAYLVDGASLAAGADNDAFTGAWECAIVPTPSTMEMQSNQYNKINVGVWKDANGKVTTSKTGTSSTSNTANSYDSTSYGFVWGNGTSNAVLGYAIKPNSSADAIETAQMQ